MKRLNIAIPTNKGFIHSAPLSHEVFEKYFDVIAAAYSEITGGDYTNAAGAKIAYLALKRAAQKRNMWDGAEGVANGFMNELTRVTNFIESGEQGYTALPLFHAMQQGKLDDEKEDLINALVFFNLVSMMERKGGAEILVTSLAVFYGGLATEQDVTAYMAGMKLKASAPMVSTAPAVVAPVIPNANPVSKPVGKPVGKQKISGLPV